METPQGGVWESNAIARYIARLADKGLFGKTAIDAVRVPTGWLSRASFAVSAVHKLMHLLQAHVEQWIDFSTTEVDAPLCSWLYPVLYPSHFPHDQKVIHVTAVACWTRQ